MPSTSSLKIVGSACSTVPDYLPFSAWAGHYPFARWIVEVVRPSILVELGVYAGGSYCAFCQAVEALKLPTKCYGVDTWRGDEHAGIYDDKVYDALVVRHDTLYGSFSRLVKSTFDEAADHFGENSVDILHIDGYHTYDAVKADFYVWYNKLSEKGIVLFHDINVRESNFGVWRFWDEIKTQYPHFSFLHSHGLGVLGVGRDLPESILELFVLKNDEIAEVRERFEMLGRPFKENCDYILAERSRFTTEIGKYHAALTSANDAYALLQAQKKKHNEGCGEQPQPKLVTKCVDAQHVDYRQTEDIKIVAELNNEIAQYHIALMAANELYRQLQDDMGAQEARLKAEIHRLKSSRNDEEESLRANQIE